MARYSPCSKHAIVLRMIVFSAGVLAVLLAGATLGCGCDNILRKR
ncbi:MAG: hypothetical protein ACXQTY_00245 [Candidatus Methanogasteraceae archaeon]